MAGHNALPFVVTGDVKRIFKLLDDLRVNYVEEGDTAHSGEHEHSF